MAQDPIIIGPTPYQNQNPTDMATKSGVSSAEYSAESVLHPDLNPDAIIGNILTNRSKTAATSPTIAAPAVVTSGMADKQDVQNITDLNKATTPPPGTTETTTEKKPTAESQLADLTSESQKEYDNYISKIDQYQTKADATTAALLQSIKDSFARQKKEVEQLNKGVLGAQTQAGVRAGRNIYAPEMESLRLGEEQKRGLDRLAEVDALEQQTLAQAQSAADDKDFALLDKRMSAYKDLQAEKRQGIIDLHQMTMDNEKLAMDKAKEARDIKEAADKPINESSKQAQDHLFDLGLKYPDAGIDSSDTIASATAKLIASPAYKADLAYTQAQAAVKSTGGQVTDSTIRSFAQSLLQNGTASNPFEADQMAREYFNSGFVPETTEPAGLGAKAVLEGAQRLASQNSESQQGALLRSVNQKIQSGDVLGATNDVYVNALNALSPAEKTKASGYVHGINDLDQIEQMLSEYKAAGGDTGLLVGTEKSIKNKLGKTSDPALEDIGNRIILAMSDYRKAQSGSAFTESEEKLYKQLFPNIIGSEEFNATKIKSLRDAFNNGLKSTLEFSLGPDVYDKMEGLRQAAVAAPELKKQAEKKGYDASDVDLLIKDGRTKTEIEDLINDKSFSSVGGDTNKAITLSPIAKSLVEQESGGRYDAKGQMTTHGVALGKYQILPYYHFSKIGLKDTPADHQKFLDSPELQDKLFGIIIDDLSKRYNGDPKKIAAAYYGGDTGARIVGTAAANKKQTAGGKEFPSINEYANSVVGRLKKYS